MSTSSQDLTTFGEPVWELATMFPVQGAWSVEDYLELTDGTNRLIEYTDGRIEVLEMPTVAHQLIAAHLFLLLHAFVEQHQLGQVLFAGLRVQLEEKKFREPDIVFQHKDHKTGGHDRYWVGADLVLEIVSEGHESRERDLVTKRADYAAAGIREYWIVDPLNKRIEVMALGGGANPSIGTNAPG
jgi:Uma2 family endonuclease